jgi:hypothetical protein
MRFRKTSLILVAAIFLAGSQASKADHGTYSYSGGTFTAGSGVGGSIGVNGAPMSATGASLTFQCPISTYGAGTYQINWTCAGGSVSIATPDKSVVFKGTFTSGSMTFSGGGGGKGGHVSYSYAFTGQVHGTLTAGGVTQGVNGSISQSVDTTSQVSSAPVSGGSFGWSSAYSPLLLGDGQNGRIVQVDDIHGDNLLSFGTFGSGTDQFNTIGGITQDASGRIYVTDSWLNRVVRFDDMTGKNWVELGSTGSGAKQFSAPKGVTIDAAGKIWIADSGNNRIVRMDDMTGTNWTTFGTGGTGNNQFSGPSAIAFDPSGRIYVADTNNGRLARFDDLTGTNWVTLNEVLIDPYGYLFTGIDSVSVGVSGEIYIAAGGTYSVLAGFSDMAGASPAVSLWTGNVSSMSVDVSGTLFEAGTFTPGLAEVNDAQADGYVGTTLSSAGIEPTVVYAKSTTSPPPAVGVLSGPAALSFGNQNVGEPSLSQSVTFTNIGSAAMTIHSIAAGTGFKVSNNCGTALKGGASCALAVRFDPTALGPRSTRLVLSSSGIHPLLSLALSGTGTAPEAVVSSTALNYDAQKVGTSSAAQTVTLSNNGSGPLTIQSIVATGSFVQTNNCGKTVQPGNGCTVSVVFSPSAAGAATGALTISDDALPTGTKQVVSLTGTGATTAPSLTVAPEAIQFPEQKIGTPSLSQTVTMKNGSAAAVSLGKPTYSAGFTVTTTCGATLAKGASCLFHVQFSPTASGPVSGMISIPVTGQSAMTVGLSGVGVMAGSAPALVANPTSVDFGPIGVSENPTLTFTVMNMLGVPVAIRSASLSGPSTMTLASNGCKLMLAGNGSCVVGVTFTPVTPSATIDTATFTIVEGSGAVTQVVITGEAVANGN